MAVPIRNVHFARFHYLAFISVFTFFATRCGLLDYKKYYRFATKKSL